MGFILFLLIAFLVFRIASKLIPNTWASSNNTRWSGMKYDFQSSLISLIAYMMKADGSASTEELDFVKPQLERIFGETRAKHTILQLREMLKNNIELYEVSQVINRSLDEQSKCTILSILYGIAMADGNMSNEEWQLLIRITEYIGLNRRDLDTIRITHTDNDNEVDPSVDTSYKILGIEKTASEEQVKRAFNSLAKKFCPIMTNSISKEAHDDAQIRFSKIQKAYETICSSRGIK